MKLDPRLPLPRALSAAALAELDAAVAGLERADASDVHEARKACKKLRAWARLLRAPLGEDHAVINRLLRDASRSLSARREADVARETLRSLRRARALDAATSQRLSSTLGAQAEGSAPQVHRARQLLLAARLYVAGARLEGIDSKTLRDGLSASFEMSRAGLEAARERPAAESLHEWRKAAKRHLYQRALLAPVLSGSGADAALRQLTETLGRHHDLHVLQQQLDDLPEGGLAQLRLHEAIRARQLRLERRALAAGQRVFGAGEAVGPIFALRSPRARRKHA